jgi:hypothetical protein
MRVRLVIDGATYQYDDLDNLQFDAVQKLLESISACTLFPTGPLALADEFMLTSGKSYQRMLEHKLTEKDNEIARRIKALTDAVNANGELTGKIADLIGNVAMAKAENSGLRQEMERMRDELGSRHQIIVDQAGEIRGLRQQLEQLTAELDAARFALPAQPQPVPFYLLPYPPPWLWPHLPMTAPHDTTIKITCEAKQ